MCGTFADKDLADTTENPKMPLEAGAKRPAASLRVGGTAARASRPITPALPRKRRSW